MATTMQQIETPKHARALDTSGNNNHGQIYSGRALEFDGVTDYLDTGLVFHPEPNHTIAVWAKANSDGNWKMLVDGRDANDDGIKLTFQNDDQIEYSLNAVDVITVDSGLGKFADRWVRIVTTYDGSTAKIYINGIKAEMNPDYTGESITPGNFNTTTETWKIGRKAYGTENYFDGFMSDVQIWNTAWTADDVTYDYLNPEYLALNRSGTSLTNSNLKIWYPMQDGHRGQQSYVLDASNTGLGDNILLNSTFDTSISIGSNGSGWSSDPDGGTSVATFDSGGGKIFYDGSNHSRLRARDSEGDQDTVMTIGTTYKLVYDVIENNGVVGNFNFSAPSTSVGYSVGTHTYYFTATTAVFQLFLGGGDNGDYIIVDNVYLYPVNDKNPATTVFYGDEMITDSKNRDIASTPDWAAHPASGEANTPSFGYSGELHLTGTSSTVPQGVLLDDSELTTPVVGRTYRVSAEIWWNTSVPGGVGSVFKIQYAGTTSSAFAVTGAGDASTTDAATYTVDLVAVSTTGDLLIYYESSNPTKWYVDDISVKEIGVASGWTDADQQLHIPQTALQSYNELLYCFGSENDHITSVSIPNDATLNVGTADFSISLWFRWDGGGSSYRNIISKGGWSAAGYSIALDGDGKLAMNTSNAGSGNNRWGISSTIPIKGKWYHVVGVWDRSHEMKMYVNGEPQSMTGHELSSYTSLDLDTTNNIKFYKRGSTSGPASGCLTEIALFKGSDAALNQAEVNELYNDGKALDVTTHSKYSTVTGYWRNNGLSVWKDLTTNSNDSSAPTGSETLLIPSGVDSSRDSQGFIMNRQKNTSSLNLPLLDTVFSNSSDYVDVGTIFNNDIFSLCCWIKVPNTGVIQRIVDNRNNSVEGWQLYVDASGNIKFQIGDTTADAAVADDTGGDVDPDTWVHVTVTYAGSGGDMVSYINGDAATKQTKAATGVQNQSLITTAMKIGARNFSNVEYGTKGQIDGVLFYTDVLSDTEVLRNYDATKSSHTN